MAPAARQGCGGELKTARAGRPPVDSTWARLSVVNPLRPPLISALRAPARQSIVCGHEQREDRGADGRRRRIAPCQPVVVRNGPAAEQVIVEAERTRPTEAPGPRFEVSRAFAATLDGMIVGPSAADHHHQGHLQRQRQPVG